MEREGKFDSLSSLLINTSALIERNFTVIACALTADFDGRAGEFGFHVFVYAGLVDYSSFDRVSTVAE